MPNEFPDDTLYDTPDDEAEFWGEYDAWQPGYCEACREDHSQDEGPELDRHDRITWREEEQTRTGLVVFASTTPGAYWVLPDTLSDHHEVEVLVSWHYLSGFVWQRTVYDDHVRGW